MCAVRSRERAFDEKDSEAVSSKVGEVSVIGAKVSAAVTSHAALMEECAMNTNF